jgi:hypothetical protein
MNLSPKTKSVIVGSLLGDAYLYQNGTLQIEHQLKHADYVRWKYKKLQDIAGRRPTIREFYNNRKKVIPAKIDVLLDPLAMAVWFMDDGSRGARTPKGVVINTSSYTRQEQSLLQSVLAEKFGLRTSVHKVGKGCQIYIKRESFERFAKLVSPFLIPCMYYKLPIDPVTTSL